MKMRSLLFVPGDRPQWMTKAAQSGADALILDLEDSVAGSQKSAARRDVHDWLACPSRPLPVLVRLNALSSGLVDADLAALADAPPDGWVLPKAEGGDSIRDLGERAARHGFPPLRILPIATETPTAVFRLGDYASVAGMLLGLTWGAEDLAAAIGAENARLAAGGYTPPFELARALTVLGAHAAHVPAIDTVYPVFSDAAGLAAQAARGLRDGFSGMLAIHPSQVDAINAAYTPSAASVERARRIVAAFDAQPGAGAVSIEGAMYDAPHLRHARRILAGLS